MTYQKKLKDPRWQKKRLEILERDEWTCQNCYDMESTLHIHHKVYNKGKEPWDIENDFLVTLCSECHEEESQTSASINQSLIREVRRYFNSSDIIEIALGFHEMELVHVSEVVASAIKYSLVNPDTQRELVSKLFSEK